MELSQLEVFLAVARERRFSRAAEKLFRTQSAVSQTIRKLEDESTTIWPSGANSRRARSIGLGAGPSKLIPWLS